MQKNVQHHEFHDQEREIKLSSDRSFGLIFAGAFLVIGLLPLIHDGEMRIWALITAGVFLVVTLVYPKILHPLNKLWQKLGLLLHAIIQPVVLGILFFLVFTPMAILARIVKKNFLHLGFEPDAESYWIRRHAPESSASESMKHQF